jgi:hypothetical protein
MAGRLAFRRRTSSGGGGDMNTYYDSFTGHADLLGQWSLRSQANILSLGIDPYGDGDLYFYDTTQDALLMRWKPDMINFGLAPGVTSPVFPVNLSSGEYLVIWHCRYGDIWRPVANGGGVRIPSYTHKEWQLRFDVNGAGAGKITWETCLDLTQGDGSMVAGANPATDVGLYHNRCYTIDANEPLPADNSPRGYVDTGANPVTPPGRDSVTPGDTPIRFHEWIRYIQHVKLNVDRTAFPEWEADTGLTLASETYHSISAWMQTPRGLVRMAYKIPINRFSPPQPGTIRNGLCNLLSEQDTSSHQIPPSGHVVITGTPGSSIPSNQQVTRNSDGARYTNTGGATTIPGGGSYSMPVTGNIADEMGPEADTASGVAMTVTSPQAGVNAAATVDTDGITGGQYFITSDGLIWLRDVIILQDYTSAAFASATPENDALIFADMAAWA